VKNALDQQSWHLADTFSRPMSLVSKIRQQQPQLHFVETPSESKQLPKTSQQISTDLPSVTSSSLLQSSEFPLCHIPQLQPPPQRNGRYSSSSSKAVTDTVNSGIDNKRRLSVLANGPVAAPGTGGFRAGTKQISSEGSSPGPFLGSITKSPGSSLGRSRSQLRHLGLTSDPAIGCVTAPNSGKVFNNENGSGRIFFPPECDTEIDPRFAAIRDTSFSWESIDSQAGSRQSLLDTKGRCQLIGVKGSGVETRVISRSWQETESGACGAGDARGEEMDLSRKQREQRKKDIREQFGLSNWNSERNHQDRRCCTWTWVFDPSGRLVYYWSFIVSLAFLYNFWVIIYRTAFDEIQRSTVLIWFALDYFADFIYLMDILIHFRTGYLEDGVLQTETIKLRQHYMNTTTFYIDLLCLLPLDFLYLSLDFQSMLRVCRLVKIYRFWEFLDRTERHTNYPNMFRLCSLMHYLLVAFHWNSCIFYAIHKGTGFGSGNNTLFGQEYPDLAKEYRNMSILIF